MIQRYKGAATKAIALSVVCCFTGCASIVSKSSWPVSIQSNPSGAKCLVAKEDGTQIHKGETPMSITLESGDGFFQRAKYSVTCDKDGYETVKAEASSYLNGWYFGNIVFGGLIGLLIVDPATGAMYRMDDTQLVTLQPQKHGVQTTPSGQTPVALTDQGLDPKREIR